MKGALVRIIPWLRTDPVLAADTLARYHERLNTQLLGHPSEWQIKTVLGEVDVLLGSIFAQWLMFRRDYAERVEGLKCEWCQRPLVKTALWTKGSVERPSRGFCDPECLCASRLAEVWRRVRGAERVRQHRMRKRLFAEWDRLSRRSRGNERRQL